MFNGGVGVYYSKSSFTFRNQEDYKLEEKKSGGPFGAPMNGYWDRE